MQLRCIRARLITGGYGTQQYLEGVIFDISTLCEERELLRAKEKQIRVIARSINQPTDIINTLANLCLLSLAEGNKHFSFLEEKLNKIIDQSERLAEFGEQMIISMQSTHARQHTANSSLVETSVAVLSTHHTRTTESY